MNLDSYARQTNIQAKLPETGYTRKLLDQRGPTDKNQGPKSLVLPQKRGNGVEPRIDLRRVAPSRLPEGSYAYIYPCIWPKRGSFRF